MQRRLGEYLDKIITIHRPGEKLPSKPLEPPPSSAPGIRDTAVEQEGENEGEEEEEEEEEEGDVDSLAAALRKKKHGLKPTQTVEHPHPVIGVEGGGRGDGLTNIKKDEEKREFFDSPLELQRKVDKVVKWIRESKHAIFFTGAGISTRFVAVNRCFSSYTSFPSLLSILLLTQCWYSRFPQWDEHCSSHWAGCVGAASTGSHTREQACGPYTAGTPNSLTHGHSQAAGDRTDEVHCQPECGWPSPQEWSRTNAALGASWQYKPGDMRTLQPTVLKRL